jgi:Kdo2-lipid IVA lauroyltransferase/acyltransferase
MASKPRNRTLDYLVYLVVRGLVAVVQAVPTPLAFRLGDFIGWIGYRVDKRHRNVAAENLRFAFPDAPPDRIEALVRGCFQHFATLLIEIILLPRKLTGPTWRKYATVVNGEPVMSALLDSRPCLVVTAHFGNWEMAGYALGAFGFRSYAIARVLDNPHLERFLKRFRQNTGQTMIAKKDEFDKLEAVLRTGANVCTVADQDAGPRGVFVNFFGRPASAHKAVALMALEFNAKLAVIGVPRIGPFRFEIVCEDAIDPADYAGRPDAVQAITQRYHAAIERLVNRHPEQYFWLHRRWKTAPAVKKSARVAA